MDERAHISVLRLPLVERVRPLIRPRAIVTTEARCFVRLAQHASSKRNSSSGPVSGYFPPAASRPGSSAKRAIATLLCIPPLLSAPPFSPHLPHDNPGEHVPTFALQQNLGVDTLK